MLRDEPPSYHMCRWSTADAEFHGTTIHIPEVASGRGMDDRHEGRRHLNREPGTVPGVMAGDVSDWLGALDEAAVTKVLSVYLPADAKTSSLDDVATATGVEVARLRLFWQALGFARLDDDERELTDADVELLATFVAFFADRTREQGVGLQMARVLGSNLDRIASAQVDMLVARVLLSSPHVDVATERSREFSALMPRLLELVWRRHLAAGTQRRLLRPTVGDTATVCVGFADMVGFTATAQKLNQLELARIVGWFEAEAYEIVASGGGRVVKTIGDEVMFMADDVRAGAAIAVDLARRFGDDPVFPDVHVGVTSGPVIHRRGDVYGPTVNRAARITGVALPGTVLVSDDVHALLADDPAFDFRSSFEHDLDDIGPVTLWRVRRPGTPGVASRALLAAGDTWRTRIDAAGASALAADQVDQQARSVLAAPLDPRVQVDLLAELYATAALAGVAEDADRQVAESDEDAVELLRRIEEDTVRRIAVAQAEARQQVAAALRDAGARTRAVDAEAGERVQALIERARRAESEARGAARARAIDEVGRARGGG